MQDFITALPAVSALIEKAGIIGVLVILGGLLAWEVLRLRRELAKCYRERDKARYAVVKCRAALDAAGIKVDLTDIADLLGAETA